MRYLSHYSLPEHLVHLLAAEKSKLVDTEGPSEGIWCEPLSDVTAQGGGGRDNVTERACASSAAPSSSYRGAMGTHFHDLISS